MALKQEDKHYDNVKITLKPILENIDLPVVIKTAILPGDSGESLFVATLPGKVWIVRDDKKCVFFDLEKFVLQPKDLDGSLIEERGLLGMEFHPNFSKNGRFYLHYSLNNQSPKIRLFDSDVTKDEYDHINVVEEWKLHSKEIYKTTTILKIRQPFFGNNGYNTLIWSPDSNSLILTIGDGGSIGDPYNYAQDNDALFGKIIAIDVEGKWCDCLEKQPALVKFSKMAECHQHRFKVLAKGIQNPSSLDYSPNGLKYLIDGFRFSITEGTNFANEVNAFHEYDVNFGWRSFEGFMPTLCLTKCNDLSICFPNEVQKFTATHRPFVVTYHHESRRNESREILPSSISLTGGRVYLGKQISGLTSSFIFSEWASQIENGQGVLFHSCANPDNPEESRLHKVIDIVNRPEKAKYFTTLGTDTKKQFLLLGTYVSHNPANRNQGTVYELIPFNPS